MPERTNSLHSLLHPRSVAVVGASDNPDKVGGRPLRHLLAHGFAGRLYPVTQRGDPVQGLDSCTSLAALPEVPDVAILCVPAERAAVEIEACAQLGVPNVLLFSSGFAEVSDAGSSATVRTLAQPRPLKRTTPSAAFNPMRAPPRVVPAPHPVWRLASK